MVGTVCLGFDVIGKKEKKMTLDLSWFGQWGLRPLNLFLLIIDHFYNRVGMPLYKLYEK